MSARHEFDHPWFPQQSLWDLLTEVQPLRLQAKDRQVWAIASWGMADLRNRQIYLDESLTPAVWLEILSLYRAGDLAAIGHVMDRAIRTPEIMAMVDKENDDGDA